MKKALVILFLSLIVIKLLLIPLVPVPLGYSDSLAYFEQAKTFFDTGSFTQLIETAKFPPLYALAISPAYLFEDMNTVFLVMKIINTLLSSLIIFPAYILAREFLNKKKSCIIATLSSFIPTIFTMNFYIFSENLFFPLFLFSVYFIYKTFSEYKWYWALLTGFFIGLSLLTRFAAIILLGTIILITIKKLFQREKKALFTAFISLSAFLLTITPWLYTKTQIFGWSIQGILLGYSPELQTATQQNFIFVKLIWAFLYTNYLFLALGIIIVILAFQFISNYKNKNKKEKTLIEIILCLSIITIALAANNSGNIIPYTAHRVIGRYIAMLFPFWLLLSFLTDQKIKKSYILITALFLLISTPFILFGTFFPINNSELIWIEISKIILNETSLNTIFITIVVTFFTLSLLFIKKIKTKTYFTFLAILFIGISLLSTAAIIYDAQERWYPLEEIQLGIWISKNLPDNASFYFDPEDLEYFEERDPIDRTNENNRPITVIAYWIRGEIINQKTILNIHNENYPTNADYIITTKELDLELIKEGDTIKIYKNA